MDDLLFVYGTLRRGSEHPMAAWLAARADWLGAAAVSGKLYRVSYYPGLAHGTGQVSGDVFRLRGEDLEATWVRLDEFEEIRGEVDDEYRREATQVCPANGRQLSAQAYWYIRPTTGLELVAGGDWLAGV